jgi:hypothetical protein
MVDNGDKRLDRKYLINAVIAISAVLICAIFYVLFLMVEWTSEWTKVALEHFRVTVWLPIAAALAFFVVAFFETTAGRIQFEFLGFKFAGASGPILMWILCFLSVVFAVRTLW